MPHELDGPQNAIHNGHDAGSDQKSQVAADVGRQFLLAVQVNLQLIWAISVAVSFN